MHVEIERKFLVDGTPPLQNGVKMVQGYLCHDKERTIRVRIEGSRAVMTVKGVAVGISRAEFEYEIPLDDAKKLHLLVVGSLVEKTRYYHPMGDHVWEIDVFEGANKGLVIAEIELKTEQESFAQPEWLGEEVSHDRKYANSSLAQHPYSEWA